MHGFDIKRIDYSISITITLNYFRVSNAKKRIFKFLKMSETPWAC